MYKFKVDKAITEEFEAQVEYGTHYFQCGTDYFLLVIKQDENKKYVIVDELRVVLEKGLDTKIIYKENEHDLPYNFKMFLAGSGPGKIITKDQFNKVALEATNYIYGVMLNEIT